MPLWYFSTIAVSENTWIVPKTVANRARITRLLSETSLLVMCGKSSLPSSDRIQWHAIGREMSCHWWNLKFRRAAKLEHQHFALCGVSIRKSSTRKGLYFDSTQSRTLYIWVTYVCRCRRSVRAENFTKKSRALATKQVAKFYRPRQYNRNRTVVQS